MNINCKVGRLPPAVPPDKKFMMMLNEKKEPVRYIPRDKK